MARVERERTTALGERQREDRRSQDQGTTRHMTPGNERGAPGTARPKGSGFNRACEPASHAERHLDRHIRTEAEDADVDAAHVLVIVGGMDADNAYEHVRPDTVPEAAL